MEIDLPARRARSHPSSAPRLRLVGLGRRLAQHAASLEWKLASWAMTGQAFASLNGGRSIGLVAIVLSALFTTGRQAAGSPLPVHGQPAHSAGVDGSSAGTRGATAQPNRVAGTMPAADPSDADVSAEEAEGELIAPPVDEQTRILAGHLLRRIGFGPNAKELARVLRRGRTAYINEQLNPRKIGDGAALKGAPPPPRKSDEDYDWIRRWYVRMANSRRQLQEKMTLIWHEHFATSNEKVGVGLFMNDQEEFLRANALGTFRDLLVGITRDQAMLIWLDNNNNDGRGEDPPNENYAREFLQLFSVGTTKLNLDGTPELDAGGNVQPAYTENDIREIARALTGWSVPYPFRRSNTKFDEFRHDEGSKTIMGSVLVGRTGEDGALEVEDVVDLVLRERESTVAAFISKMLIQKLATETPAPQYVQDVATVFITSHGSIKETVRAILMHPEFTSTAVIGSMYKEPIEQYIGAIRALGATTKGEALVRWTYDAGQLIYYPPSVFSFYRPGDKGSLISTAMVLVRDKTADEFVRGWDDTTFDAEKMIRKARLTTPAIAVDYLSSALLTAQLRPEVRDRLIDYMNGEVTEGKVRGVVWLILCSPEFQKN